MNRTDNLVVENTFVVVHVLSVVRVEAVEVLSQLGEVVCAACLVDSWVWSEVYNLCVWLAEHFAVAHTARSVCVTSLNHVPEVERKVVVVWVCIAAIAAECACNLRDVLVGMTSADVVDVL